MQPTKRRETLYIHSMQRCKLPKYLSLPLNVFYKKGLVNTINWIHLLEAYIYYSFIIHISL